MPNSLTQSVRRSLAEQGQRFDGSDDDLTVALAKLGHPELLDDPEFQSDYAAIREANAPSLMGEAGNALKAGTQGLFSTLDESAALGAKVVGLDRVSDFYKERAKQLEDLSAESAPTIPTAEDVAPGEPKLLDKIFSKDAARYAIYKAGSVAPSIAESALSAGIGALAGSAMAPGPGTVAGAGAGLLESSLTKAAIKRLLAEGAELTAENISKTAKAIGAFRGGVAATAASSAVLNTGDVASEGADPATTIGLGIISAIPDTILPTYVLSKLFPGKVKSEAIKEGKNWLMQHARKIGELIGIPAGEFGQEYFQEAINVVARNVKEGKDPLTFDDADFRRLREAGIAGFAGGLLAAPGAMLAGRRSADETTPKSVRQQMAEQTLAEQGLPPAPTREGAIPQSPIVATPTVSVERRVARMSPEQQQARFAELSARTDLTPDEQREVELLRAFVGEEAPPAVPVPTPSPVTSLPAPSDQTMEQLADNWDVAHRHQQGNDWFEGGNATVEVNQAFARAAENGAGDLRSHGMAKAATLLGAVKNLLGMLTNGLDPTRGGGELHYAPLAMEVGSAHAGTTANGTAYRTGPFILVARPGQEFTGKLDGVGAILVNDANAEILDALRERVRQVRPDIRVELYSQADKVTSDLVAPHTTPVVPALANDPRARDASGNLQTEPGVVLPATPESGAGQSIPVEVVAGEATGPRSNFETTGMVFPTEAAAIANADPNQRVRRTAGGSFEVVENHAPVGVEPAGETVDLPARLATPPSTQPLTYEEFSKRYTEAFDNSNLYTPGQVGQQHFTDQMAKLADEYPEYLARFEADQGKAALASKREKFAAIQAKMAERKAEVERQIAEVGSDARGIRLDSPSGQHMLLTPSASEGGKWQLSWFGTNGEPFGHAVFNSRDEALRSGMGQSTKEAGPPHGSSEYKISSVEKPESLVRGPKTGPIPIADIVLSTDVPQFKSGANESGVVKPLGGKFDPTGVGPVQLWRRTNGQLELISGRHRFDLAKRSGEKTISAQIHDESAGFDQRAAARIDAELNIRDEQGTISDYANYFKNSDLSEEDAKARGLLARSKGRTGFELARNAGEDLFALHQAGRISDAQAEAIIAVAGAETGLQQVGIAAALQGATGERVGDLVAIAKSRANQRAASGNQSDLFGFDDTAMREMEAQAKLAQAERGDIRAQIQAVKGAAKKPELARKMGVDAKDPASILRKVAELEERLTLLKEHPEQAGKPAEAPAALAPLPTNVIPIDEIPFNLASEEVKAPESAIANAENQAAIQAEQDRQTDMFGDAKLMTAAVEVRDNQGHLLAPNGKRSKLTTRQWHQVRTPEFKAWFGDWEKNNPWMIRDENGNVSYAVDIETGEPKVFYHGTKKAGFTSFDPTKTTELGFHFGTQSQAEAFSKEDGSAVYPVFLNIRNPVFTKDVYGPDPRKVAFQLRRSLLGKEGDAATSIQEDMLKSDMPTATGDAMVMSWGWQNKGHDGFIYRNAREGDVDDPNNTAYVVFNPWQIKSAIANTGAFDPSETDVALMERTAPQPVPVATQAAQVNQLATAVSRLTHAGMNVDVYMRAVFQERLSEELGRRMDALIARYQNATEERQPAVQRQIENLQQQITALESGQVQGIALSPTHIAIALDNVTGGNLTGLVALMHEGGHAILGQNPAMQARVVRAVEQTFAQLRSDLAASQARTGIGEFNLGDPEELVVSTLAQKLALEGIPESPSLARAIWGWVKDLYYRSVMGLQAAAEQFTGRAPNPQVALDWIENELRRAVGGDYDYRFANLFDRLQPEPIAQTARRMTGTGTTPGNLTNFFDRRAEGIRQPMMLGDSSEAVEWNNRMMVAETGAANPGDELDIPYTEEVNREGAASMNVISKFADEQYAKLVPAVEGQPRMSFDEFWAAVNQGETPHQILDTYESKSPGSATAEIGGERMTDPMNGAARIEAKRLVYQWQNHAIRKMGDLAANIETAEGKLDAAAKKQNKLDGDLRNAELHEAQFKESLKADIKELVENVRRGFGLAKDAGELAGAIREIEGLADDEAIPKEYQRVFGEVFRDEVSLFAYMQALAKLEMPLHEMTAAEVIAGIEDNAGSDPALARLMEAKNKPLLAAIVTLARKNAQQVDMLNLRLIADPEKYLALQADVDEIRRASVAELRAMEKRFNKGARAATFADRLKQNLVRVRRDLRKAQATIQEAEARHDLLGKVRVALTEKIDQMETDGLAAPSEWTPGDGKVYYAMSQAEDGSWRKRDRTLAFTREGPAVDAAQVAADMVANRQYLAANESKRGSKLYESVARMTQEIDRLDVFQTYPELNRWFTTQMFLPSADALLSGGGSGGARASQMLKRFGSIILQNWQSEVNLPAAKFVDQWNRTAKAAGFTNREEFWNQVVEPAVYAIQANPGLEEGAALREGVRAGRRNIVGDPAPDFDEQFRDLLRQTRSRSEFFRRLFEKEGLFVEDPKLGGELRQAVPRGWMTLIRRINSATVSTITRDMERAGWTIEFVDPKNNDRPVSENFETAMSRKRKIVGATTFDSLLPSGEDDDQTREAKKKVLSDPEAFAQAISGFFTPGIVRRWLAPFINKPGQHVFSHNKQAIDQLDVQQAWVQSGGDVAKWIDLLGARIGLEQEAAMDEEGADVALPEQDVETQWRIEMLRKLNGLFLRTSKVAADSNQVKDLWDQVGQPSHLLMDARGEDWLPPEFLQSMTFDPVNSRNLLSTLAFHAAFGRNGLAMVKAMGETQSALTARREAFRQITGTTKAAREAQAKESGYTYKELRDASKLYDQQMAAQELLKAQFGFGQSAGVFGDLRGGLELLHFIAGQTTNNIKTGLLNLLQPAQRALARRSMGPQVIRDTAGAYGGIAYNFLGGVLEKFGLHLLRSTEHAKDIAAMQGAGIGQLSNAETMALAVGKRGEELPTAIKTGRAIVAAQHRGLGAKPKEFNRANVIPFFENTMASLGMTAAIANGTQEAVAIERIVKAGIDYFAAHPEDAANPAFRLTARDLGMDTLGWFGDRGSFDYFRRKLPDYGFGSLENLTRGAMERAKRGEPLLTKDHVAAAANLSGNELDLMGGINTNPASWSSNPFLQFATPLLGWPIRQMNAVHQSFREADGRGSALAAARAVGILAAWSLPIGLAFTFLTDEWDDKFVKKKANLGRLPGVAGVPVIGPALALATSDIPALEQFKSMMMRSSRAGNIYGLGQDFISNLLSGLDPTSGQRPFSLDSRILAFSQLRTIADAMNSFINTGGAVTWSSVERPLIAAMGGNGALSAIDVFNNALGLDNAQARMVQRTNATAWIREAGQATGLQIRKSGGASTAPTPVSVWVREMSFASYANDRMGFLDAYQRAIAAAREMGQPEPEAAVLQTWRSRDPLEVLAHKPTDLQLARMMAAMDDNGKTAVREALRLYEHYTDLIKPSPIQQQMRRQESAFRRSVAGPNIESLRRQMAGSALSVR